MGGPVRAITQYSRSKIIWLQMGAVFYTIHYNEWCENLFFSRYFRELSEIDLLNFILKNSRVKNLRQYCIKDVIFQCRIRKHWLK